MRSRLALSAAALAAMMWSDLPAAASQEDVAYVNGRWFDGTGFSQRTLLVHNGVLRTVASAPAGARVVDLQQGYVVPPYCEAHNHNLGIGRPEQRNSKYLSVGVFYVQILNDSPDLVAAERDYWARPDTIDVAFAHGGLTGRGGHPVELLEGIKRSGGYPPGTVLADRAYYEVSSVDELVRKWPMLTAANPDIVKVFLQFSEDYERRKDDPAFFGNRGVSPAVFARAVKLARRDGRRVAVHVTSTHDFHLAVEAGVDVIAHLPGYMSLEPISATDAAMAARKKIVVIATASLVGAVPAPGVTPDALKAAQRENLQRLKAAGVTVTIGSDGFGDTSHNEVQYLRRLGVYSDLELLRTWTMTCPRVVFPARRIGSLADSYEANFLVLAGDPLQDFANTRRIRMMVKGGVPITQPAPS
jgi:imidazolonepropionase-like amidohydrolase